jgi:plastocyanin
VPEEFRGPLLAGYGPFNIQRIGQKLYVTYAKQDGAAHDDVAGAGNGFVYVFSLDGHLLTRMIEGGALNSPWGVVIAPEFFGPFSQTLLVGNFGDGMINAYDPCSGQWLAALGDPNGKALAIPGLWGLRFGNGHNGGEAGVLYFTAGIPGSENIEDHGLFGSIRPVPPALSAPPSTTPPPNYAVNIQNLQFMPDAITIQVGGVLTWTNGDGFAHTVKGDNAPFASGRLDQNTKFSQTFDAPGTYNYHCTIHPFMQGKVVVQ